MGKNKLFGKKTFLTILALVMMLFSFTSLAGCSNVTTGKEITVFSWEDYMDVGETDSDGTVISEGLIEEFEKENGIKVNYRTFATCEAMYNELKKDPKACDLICPSEYMILKMKDEGLIQPYTMPQNYVNYGSSYIKSVFDSIGLNDKATGKTYAIGYMWGTMGLIYNADKYKADDFDSWNNMMTDDRFVGKMTIKDSLRDSYILALALAYKGELEELNARYTDKSVKEYQDKLKEIFNRTDQASIDNAGDKLSELKKRLHSFEVDGGKMDLLTGKIDINFAWSGDAVCAMYDEDRIVKLGYAVPKEGSNVWFDGWVMTKDADVENSIKFLDFLCLPKNAVRNMNYIGYTSCIAGEEVFNDYVVENFEEDGEIPVDLSYFFDPSDTTGAYVVNVSNPNGELFAQYADSDTIYRCAVMKNFSDTELEKLDKMWTRVKLITLPTYVIILIVVGVVLLIVAAVLYKFREKIFGKLFANSNSTHKRKGYKTIKIENIDDF